MAINLLELFKDRTDGPFTENISKFIGKSGKDTESTMKVIASGLLGSLSAKCKNETDAQKVVDYLDDNQHDGSVLESAADIFADKDKTDQFTRSGDAALNFMLGDKSGNFTDWVKNASGTGKKAAGSLTKIATPMLLGSVGKIVKDKKLDGAGLKTLLAGQNEFLKTTPKGLGRALGFAELKPDPEPVYHDPVQSRSDPEHPPVRASHKIWPWILLLAALVLLLLLWRGCGNQSADIDEKTARESTKVGELAGKAADKTEETVQAVGETAKNVADSAVDATGNAAKATGDLAGKAVDKTREGAEAVAVTTGNAVDSVVDTAGSAAKAAGELAGKAADKTEETAQAVGETAKNVADPAVDATGNAAKATGDLAGKAADKTKEAGQVAGETAKNIVGSTLDTAGSAARATGELTGKAVDKTREAAKTVAVTTGNVAESAADTTGSAVNATGDLIGKAADKTIQTAQAVGETAGSTSQNIKETLYALMLPDGTEIKTPKESSIERFVNFIKSDTTDYNQGFSFDRINFETGTSNLTADSQSQVNNLAAVLKAYPDVTVRLEGHTDNVGDPLANKQLSENRANYVRNHIVQKGIVKERISTIGYGQERPIASNDTEEGRHKNRRVEIYVTKK